MSDITHHGVCAHVPTHNPTKLMYVVSALAFCLQARCGAPPVWEQLQQLCLKCSEQCRRLHAAQLAERNAQLTEQLAVARAEAAATDAQLAAAEAQLAAAQAELARLKQ